jgi:hypothetical protein
MHVDERFNDAAADRVPARTVSLIVESFNRPLAEQVRGISVNAKCSLPLFSRLQAFYFHCRR